MQFTKKSLESLLGRTGERLVIHDPKTPGLRAELREGGSIAYYVFKRVAGGGPVRRKIGDFPFVTIEQARKAAIEELSRLSQGINVAIERRHERDEPTLGELFNHWLETHAKLHKRTWQEDQRLYDNFLAKWKNRRLSEVRHADVQAAHSRIGKANGPYAANRVLALIRAMFNKAPGVGFTGPNPTKGITKFREQSRARFLQPSELPAFMDAVKAEPNETIRDFFKLALFTGARKANVLAMRWENIDLQSATWRIPGEFSKNGEPLTVHLPPAAVELLTARKAIAGKNPWVLESGKGHLAQPRHAWERLIKRAGLDGLRIHDLRRSLGSWQAAAGASLSVIGKSLGHRDGSQATAIYARLNLDPVRASVDTAVAAMLAAAQPKEGAKDAK